MNAKTVSSIRMAASSLVCLGLVFQSTALMANPFAVQSPYTFGVPGRTIADLTEYQKPNQMVSILPNRPVAARDKNGNRLYFTPGGKLALSVSTDGKMTFSLQGKSRERDVKGNLTRTTEMIRGTNRQVTKNEKGEVLGYKELGYGGKVLREYDHENNLTKTYHYNQYGKSIQYVVDELSQSKTVFNKMGQAAYDVDYEGNKVAVYKYDDRNRLVSKTDQYDNTTYFDIHGNLTQTQDYKGNVVAQYVYKYNDSGYYVLDKVEDPRTGNVTYYDETGKQTVTKNSAGAVVTDFMWDGSKLTCTFDRESQETTWYDIGGKPTYTSYNDEHISTWLYYKGKMVGVWDARKETVTIFKNQRDDITIGGIGSEPPSAEQIEKWVQEGLIEKSREQGVGAVPIELN